MRQILKIRNIRRFIAFRIFFNARFYYPVFTILFLDFGLTLEDFALLNAVWAASIVACEVPSGALADIVGRKTLLVGASGFMMIEIALLCFVPLGNHRLLFTVFLINRLLSGMAEASASGADEAIAYDSLKAEGAESHWGWVLEKQMRYKAGVSVVAMTMGALVYDPAILQRAADVLGLDIRFTQEMTIRFPLYLTLGMAVAAFFTTLGMVEPFMEKDDCSVVSQCGHAVSNAFRLTLQAGLWILKTPWALVIILSGMMFDGIIRMFITMTSQYFRMIDLPEAGFGVIGASFSLLGLFIPRLARYLAENRTPLTNLFILGASTMVGFYLLSLFIPIYGLIPAALMHAVMVMISFFISHYLNRITDSSQRATVLSFKGLSYNLAYGLIGILYSTMVAFMKRNPSTLDHIAGQTLEDQVFTVSMSWFPVAFGVIFPLLLIFAIVKLRGATDRKFH